MLHKNMPAAERHAPWSWEFADAAARTGATGFVATDVGKVALQSDNGTGWVLMSTTPTWQQLGSATVGRELLTADRTYYVAPTGSDSNNGLSAGAPFLTIQKAVDVAAMLDQGIFSITINVGNGTYAQSVVLKNPVGSGDLYLTGNQVTPSQCLISPETGYAITSTNRLWKVSGFKLVAPGAGIRSDYGNELSFNKLDFGACGTHVLIYGGSVTCTTLGSDYTISGSATIHAMVSGPGAVFMVNGTTITLTGTPAFSTAFVYCANQGGAVFYLDTFIGAATGKRFDISTMALVNAYGAGANFLPGNVAGTTATGGQYA